VKTLGGRELALGILIGIPQPFHELHPVLRAGAEDLTGAARKHGQTKIAASAAEDNFDLFDYIFGNGGVRLKALQQFEHIGSSRNQAGIGIGFDIGFDGRHWLSTAVYDS